MRSICLGLFAAILLIGCKDKKDEATPGPTPGMPGSPGTPPGLAKVDLSVEVSGTINGQAFKPDQTSLQGDRLTFRKGKGVFGDMEIAFSLPGTKDEIREGKEWKLGGEGFGHPFLHIYAKDEKNFRGPEMARGEDYSMTLTIIKRTPKSVEGTIDLKVKKPANTNLSGKFTAVVKKTGTDPLDADDVPYIQGKIVIKGDWKEERLAAGFQAKGADGKSYSNMAGTMLREEGGGSASTLSFEPQITSILSDQKDGPRFVHTRVTPGEYLIYVKRGGVLAAWKNITVKPGDQQNVDLTIDLANVGSVVATLPDEEVIGKNDFNLKSLELIPDGITLPTSFNPFLFDAAQIKEGEKTVTATNVPAGKYKAVFRNCEGMVEVTAGKESAVKLAPKIKKK